MGQCESETINHWCFLFSKLFNKAPMNNSTVEQLFTNRTKGHADYWIYQEIFQSLWISWNNSSWLVRLWYIYKPIAISIFINQNTRYEYYKPESGSCQKRIKHPEITYRLHHSCFSSSFFSQKYKWCETHKEEKHGNIAILTGNISIKNNEKPGYSKRQDQNKPKNPVELNFILPVISKHCSC